jgi:hypothetical protein
MYLDFANKNQLQQDHPCVVYLIRRNYLQKPTSLNVPYNLSKPKIINPSDGQSQAILRLLRNQVNSFRRISVKFLLYILKVF